jgi:hypothetical protein
MARGRCWPPSRRGRERSPVRARVKPTGRGRCLSGVRLQPRSRFAHEWRPSAGADEEAADATVEALRDPRCLLRHRGGGRDAFSWAPSPSRPMQCQQEPREAITAPFTASVIALGLALLGGRRVRLQPSGAGHLLRGQFLSLRHSGEEQTGSEGALSAHPLVRTDQSGRERLLTVGKEAQ